MEKQKKQKFDYFLFDFFEIIIEGVNAQFEINSGNERVKKYQV